ncbi:hypothetical protein [Actinotalea soli]|uniref:hypothetical protein n=1 Tax=Actinotalea soli TaxID=2819234 RepID=UPI0027DC9F84|nr:hypothetical protein [Actinotalea soli]
MSDDAPPRPSARDGGEVHRETATPAEEPVSAALRDAKARARSTHYTVGTLRADPDGTLWLECSCGTVLRNGPTWTIDEHVRLHRAEAKYLELSTAAPAGIPRLIEPRY